MGQVRFMVEKLCLCNGASLIQVHSFIALFFSFLLFSKIGVRLPLSCHCSQTTTVPRDILRPGYMAAVTIVPFLLEDHYIVHTKKTKLFRSSQS